MAEAIEKMKEWNVSSLLVSAGKACDTWGFMTETDVIEKVVADGLDPGQVHVHEIMSKPVITVSPKMQPARVCSPDGPGRHPARAGVRR